MFGWEPTLIGFHVSAADWPNNQHYNHCCKYRYHNGHLWKYWSGSTCLQPIDQTTTITTKMSASGRSLAINQERIRPNDWRAIDTTKRWKYLHVTIQCVRRKRSKRKLTPVSTLWMFFQLLLQDLLFPKLVNVLLSAGNIDSRQIGNPQLTQQFKITRYNPHLYYWLVHLVVPVCNLR